MNQSSKICLDKDESGKSFNVHGIVKYVYQYVWQNDSDKFLSSLSRMSPVSLLS